MLIRTCILSFSKWLLNLNEFSTAITIQKQKKTSVTGKNGTFLNKMQKRGMTHKSCSIKPLKRKVSNDEIVPFVVFDNGLFIYFDNIYPYNGFQFLQNNLKDFE